jgi:hypothetical protein
MLQPGTTERIVKWGEIPVLSGNGQYLAFRYFFGDLVPGTSPNDDIYRLDLVTRQIQLISASPTGAQGNALSSTYDSLSISADGRYVAFASDATNLVANDLNGETDVFVRDTLTGTTVLASVNSSGAQLAANTLDFNLRPAISANGQFVVFQSRANNLVPGDTNGDDQDIFVRDLSAGTTTRVSVNSNGEQTRPWNVLASADSRNPSISGDGRFVVFESNAINLDPRDTGVNNFDVFMHDRQTGQTRQVSVNSLGEVATGTSLLEREVGPTTTNWSSNPVISANGRYVVFQSGATNLVPNDTNDRVDIFRHDLETNETILISVGINGELANGGSSIGFSRNGAISSDGRYVVFQSLASNLVPDDNNNALDVFVRDVVTGTTERISVNSSGQEAVGGQAFTSSSDGTISDDGRYVSFLSRSANLVDDPLAQFNYHIYLRDRLITDSTSPPVTTPPTSSPTYNSGWVSNLLSPSHSLIPGNSIPTGSSNASLELPGAGNSQAWSQWF